MTRRTWALSIASGLLWAASLPPQSWWPLWFIGSALLYSQLRQGNYRFRVRVCQLSLGSWLAVSMWWMHEFHLIGYFVFVISCSLLLSLAVAIPSYSAKWRDCFTFGVTLSALSLLRLHLPFGGMPLGNPEFALATSPLLWLVRYGGFWLLVGLSGALAVLSVLPVSLLKKLIVFSLILLLLHTAHHNPTPNGDDIRIAAIQGGGDVGTRAIDSTVEKAFENTLKETRRFLRTNNDPPVDIILWPENVVNIDGSLQKSDESKTLSRIAKNSDVTIVAGIVESRDDDRFRNYIAVWEPDGTFSETYDKQHRVPFGEYIPFRSVLKRFVDLDAVPADAVPGTENNVATVSRYKAGVLISFEVFFPLLGKQAVNNDAEFLLVPTNAASYVSETVPRSELIAAQMRAVEANRYAVQAAPTGYTAIVSNTGVVMEESELKEATTIVGTITTHKAKTPYSKLGNWPLFIAIAVVGLSTISQRRRGKLHA